MLYGANNYGNSTYGGTVTIREPPIGQYQLGTVDMTNGSPIVTGHDTEWVTRGYVGANDLFKVLGENAVYYIQSIDSDGQITLTANYAGSTAIRLPYQITVDFTDNYNIPEVWEEDKDWPYYVTLALREIDRILYWLYDRTASSVTTTTTSSSTTSSTASTSSTTSTTTSTTSCTSSSSSTSSTCSTTTTL